MVRIINGVAYSEDYEELVGPVPKGRVETKVVSASNPNVESTDGEQPSRRDRSARTAYQPGDEH